MVIVAQPGEPRTPAQTLEVIKRQIQTACLGVQDHVDAIQTATGIKDKIAVHWMEKLVTMARERQNSLINNQTTRDIRLNSNRLKGKDREDLKQALKEQIQQDLYSWVIMQPPDRFEKLGAENPGMEVQQLFVRTTDAHITVINREIPIASR